MKRVGVKMAVHNAARQTDLIIEPRLLITNVAVFVVRFDRIAKCKRSPLVYTRTQTPIVTADVVIDARSRRFERRKKETSQEKKAQTSE